MPRQRNDTGSVLIAYELGMSIGPNEEFDSDLPVPGCVPVEKPPVAPAVKSRPVPPASDEQDKETPA